MSGPRAFTPFGERRWCPVHEVSALDDKLCWVEGCGEKTITNTEFQRIEAKKQQKVFGTVLQHEGERGMGGP